MLFLFSKLLWMNIFKDGSFQNENAKLLVMEQNCKKIFDVCNLIYR